MRFGILGSGAVGREVAERLEERGHQVRIGTRDPDATLARVEADAMGFPPFSVWHAEHPDVALVTYAQAADFGALLVNATSGLASTQALRSAEAGLSGKILLDLANPLDFSKGLPPDVVLGDHGSLGQELQAEFPEVRVVKVLNTVNLGVMFRPRSVGDGDHTIFMAGNDAEAKAEVGALLETFGWTDIIDLGDISGAQGTELLLPLWLRLYGVIGHANFNFKIVR